MGSWAQGNATRYERVQLLKAAFGQGADIPAFYYMGLSTTVPDDTGAITEVAVDNYARVKIPAWQAMLRTTELLLPTGPTSHGAETITTVTPAQATRFPNPTVTWFPVPTPVYPFLGDALVGGNNRWFWRDGLGLPGLSSPRPGHPIIFPMVDPSSPESGLDNVFIGAVTFDPFNSNVELSGIGPGFDSNFIIPIALKAMTKLISPPSAPSIYVGLGGKDIGGILRPEPGPSPLWGVGWPPGDPNYTRLLLTWSTAALDGSGNAYIQNTNTPSWHPTHGYESNWNSVISHGSPMNFWDVAGIPGHQFPQGNLLFGIPDFVDGPVNPGDDFYTMTLQSGTVKITLN